MDAAAQFSRQHRLPVGLRPREDRGTATFCHLQHHASGPAASSAVPNHVYTAETVPSVPQGHPIVNSQPDESTSVASLTAVNLEIPAATMLSRILASTLRQLLKSERHPLAADDVNCIAVTLSLALLTLCAE